MTEDSLSIRQLNSLLPSHMRYNITQARHDPSLKGYIQLVPTHQSWFTNFISVAACKTDRANKASDESEIELTKETSISLAF